ncbi:MAG: ACP S-malonyltransferase [Planctomycetota bacterium]|jgi:[acyl-carrier-protein] S-malonyltransferase|nr:ACP S-malonyltransferase [Planctomycetota bacterium]
MNKGFLLFPGQGAQVVGMAKDSYDTGGHAVALFEEASEILGFDLAQLTFQSDQETLSRTENCQPALLVSCMAILNTLRERKALSITGASGLSLGEYTALTILETLDFADAVRLVRQRGELMEAAGRKSQGGMVSVIGLDGEAVNAVCQKVTESGAGKVWAANYNCPGQVVISGEKAGLVAAEDLLREAGARKTIPLNVTGAFHTPLMEEARAGLWKILTEVSLRTPLTKFINNVDAAMITDPEMIRQSLARQLVSPVRWEQSCRLALASGEKTFFEIGPGRTLAGLMRRIDKDVKVVSISSLEDIEALPG